MTAGVGALLAMEVARAVTAAARGIARIVLGATTAVIGTISTQVGRSLTDDLASQLVRRSIDCLKSVSPMGASHMGAKTAPPPVALSKLSSGCRRQQPMPSEKLMDAHGAGEEQFVAAGLSEQG